MNQFELSDDTWLEDDETEYHREMLRELLRLFGVLLLLIGLPAILLPVIMWLLIQRAPALLS